VCVLINKISLMALTSSHRFIINVAFWVSSAQGARSLLMHEGGGALLGPGWANGWVVGGRHVT